MADPRKNPRYLAILVVASLMILLGGALLRPDRSRRGEEAGSGQAAPSPTDLARLQRLTQRRSVEAVARVFADVAAQVENRVLSLDGIERTALVWSRESALTAAGEPVRAVGRASASGRSWTARAATWSPMSPIAVVALSDGPLTPALQRYPAASYPEGDWALLVWRDAAGRLEYRSAQALGVEPASCGGLELSALTLSAPIDETMLGAGVFDLDEGLFGAVGLCEGRPMPLAVESAERLVEAMLGAEHTLARIYGLRVLPLDAEHGELLGAEDGLATAAVWRGYPAFSAGLRPGDVIVEIDGKPATIDALVGRRPDRQPIQEIDPDAEEDEAAPVEQGSDEAAAPPSDPIEVVFVRWGRQRKIILNPSQSGGAEFLPAGLRWAEPTPGIEIGALAPDGPAARAGVRPGDRLLAVNGIRPSSTQQAAELMDDFLEKPAYWMLERDGRLWGAWLRKPPEPNPESEGDAEAGDAEGPTNE